MIVKVSKDSETVICKLGEDYIFADGTIELSRRIVTELIPAGWHVEDGYTDAVNEAVVMEPPSILDRKLTIEEKRQILSKLFYMDVSDEGVIYDDEGDEFFGFAFNHQHELDTLAGIFEYARIRAETDGEYRARYEVRKALGITNSMLN